MDSKNKRKNQERYMRIAFESLADFGEKENRKNYYIIDNSNSLFIKIINLIKAGDYNEADMMLRKLIDDVALKIYNIEINIKRYNINTTSIHPSMAAEDMHND